MFVFLFETGIHYVALPGLELMGILLNTGIIKNITIPSNFSLFRTTKFPFVSSDTSVAQGREGKEQGMGYRLGLWGPACQLQLRNA